MTPYQERVLTQIENWVNGISRHNYIDDECCPDFSCCEPDLFEQDREKRVAGLNHYKDRIGLTKHLDS